ncbi:unnamed protein product [Danaus chrysippus]|uniref:(African queen) hypothetical protein n=1 Tax=Danaus chrysippus TaxID=151541 RepID=A0A8J2QMZ9_9NEOP|nr:unnamed protein product [Danaus chrysippus]
MKESYPDDIMLCFVQSYSDRENGCTKNGKACNGTEVSNYKNLKKKHRNKSDSMIKDSNKEVGVQSDIELRRSYRNVVGKSKDSISRVLPEVKRSFSDRFSVISDVSGKKAPRALLTIRKTWSTGNFSSGAAGGGCGAPRSAPATPLQLEPHRSKHDKNVKALSGSAPSMRGLSGDETTEGKQPSKSRQKKLMRHFPQVGPEERVLNYYSCALVGDLLLQGHLYITKNYFAFYSNVFGYVTKLLIPTSSVLRITKEKVARIIPNAVGVCTRDERHVFGSLLSRDSTYKLMMHVWKSARTPELTVPKPPELRTSEIEASEYSPDDSSSGGADTIDAPDTMRPEPDAIIAAAGAAVIQPALLTGAAPPRRPPRYWHAILLALALLLTCSALYFAYTLYYVDNSEDVSGEELYAELVRWRAKLHGRAAGELHAFLSTNLLLLAKVRQSLEALSGVILTDMSQANMEVELDVPNETVVS